MLKITSPGRQKNLLVHLSLSSDMNSVCVCVCVCMRVCVPETIDGKTIFHLQPKQKSDWHYLAITLHVMCFS